MSASAFRRQAIFLVLGAAVLHQVEDIAERIRGGVPESIPASGNPHEAIAQALMTSRVCDLLHALCGPVAGLVGTLTRLGSDLLHPLKYRGPVDLLSNPEHETRAKVLRQLQTIKPDTKRTLALLLPLSIGKAWPLEPAV